MNYQKNYYPRRPVKSFQDLEVYQKLLAVSVAITKKLSSRGSASDRGDLDEIAAPLAALGARNDITAKLTAIALNLPLWIAEAHSIRFSAPQAAIDKLEQTMLDCNILIVYLEQYRDIKNKDIESDFFAEQIKILLATRGQVMRLQFSWKKFAEQRRKEQNV